MTTDDIRIKLGLKPFDEFEYEQLLTLKERERYLTKGSAINERFRQTGRTTKILCDALEVLSLEQPIAFISHNFRATKIFNDRLREYAIKLGFDAELIVKHNITEGFLTYKNGMDTYTVKIFKDHSTP